MAKEVEKYLLMDKEEIRADLLRSCRYYREGEPRPHGGEAGRLAMYEEMWVTDFTEYFATGKIGHPELEYLTNLVFASMNKQPLESSVPFGLLAIIYDRYTHFGGDYDGFAEYIKEFYPE